MAARGGQALKTKIAAETTSSPDGSPHILRCGRAGSVYQTPWCVTSILETWGSAGTTSLVSYLMIGSVGATFAARLWLGRRDYIYKV